MAFYRGWLKPGGRSTPTNLAVHERGPRRIRGPRCACYRGRRVSSGARHNGGLAHRRAGSGWMFPSKMGKPHHNTSCMGKAFADCLRAINVGRRFSFHGLRRTANDLIRRMASGEVARAITGHVTQSMTEHYSHVDVGEKRAAVEGMLKLVKGGDSGTTRDDTREHQGIRQEGAVSQAHF